MVKYFCDRCGKEKKEEGSFQRLGYYSSDIEDSEKLFCKECFENIILFIESNDYIIITKQLYEKIKEENSKIFKNKGDEDEF